MTEPGKSVPHVPDLDTLRSVVTPRRARGECTHACDSEPKDRDTAPAKPCLGRLAKALLEHAAQPENRGLSMEARWKAIGVNSGSLKTNILDELRRHGFIRIERKGPRNLLHLYHKAYAYLGLSAPKDEGVGGTTHRELVRHVAGMLKARGMTVHIEQEVGPSRKRVDIVAYGEKVVGVEIGLSDIRQELINLRKDLESGALDGLLFVAACPKFLERVKTAAAKDPVIAKHWKHLSFLCLVGS